MERMGFYTSFLGKVFKLTEWFMWLVTINLLWMITNLPIVLLGLLMMLSTSTLGIIVLAIPVAILSPILLFPSTMATFAVVRELILHGRLPTVFKTYWSFFKKGYKKSLSLGSILTIGWLILVVDGYYFFEKSQMIFIVLVVIGLVLFVYTIMTFCLAVHYHMTNKEIFKNAFFITLGSPLLFFFTLIGNGLLLYVTVKKLLFLIPFLLISISVFLTFYIFYRFTLRVGEKYLG